MRKRTSFLAASVSSSGNLKPLQVALVNLIEDARVETLAMQRLPGLRRVWSPYHVAAADGLLTAPALLPGSHGHCSTRHLPIPTASSPKAATCLQRLRTACTTRR